MRPLLLGVAAAALLATPASAGPVLAKDGRFEADVSARQMSRISILGEKVVAIRKVDDPGGPQMLVETDDKSGDVFVAFDGDVAGRAFNTFLTTESGRVVQAILRPTPGEGQTILVRLEGAVTPPPGPGQRGEAVTALPPSGRRDGSGTYPERLVQFVRVMFGDLETDGVVRRVSSVQGVRAGPFSVREVSTWEATGLLGRILYLTNVGKSEEPVRLEAFLVERVLAVGASHERLRPGEQGRVFIVEESR
jgi:hypothetical protein